MSLPHRRYGTPGWVILPPAQILPPDQLPSPGLFNFEDLRRYAETMAPPHLLELHLNPAHCLHCLARITPAPHIDSRIPIILPFAPSDFLAAWLISLHAEPDVLDGICGETSCVLWLHPTPSVHASDIPSIPSHAFIHGAAITRHPPHRPRI